MNPNDILAQQQALLNQSAQFSQHVVLSFIVVQFASFIVGAWVIYMFYARSRDISTELRRIRVTYEMEQERFARDTAKPPVAATSAVHSTDDRRYMPKL